MASVYTDDLHLARLENLRLLFQLRNLAIGVETLGLLSSYFGMGWHFPLPPVLLVLISLALFNMWVWQRLRSSAIPGDNELFSNLLADIAALTAVLYFTGGASNPFIILFLFPLVISVTILPARFSWRLVAVSITCYSFLFFQHEVVHTRHNMSDEFNMHIVGMWIAFVVSASLIAYFVAKMGAVIRRQQAALAKARENTLRDKQIVALGTLAASTAHELGTPLGTMSLIASELKAELKNATPAVVRDLDMLKLQVDRCKRALRTLSTSAGTVHLTSGGLALVKIHLQNICNEWRQHRPEVSLKTQWHNYDDEASMLTDVTLVQAITTILDNAAEVSPSDVEWAAEWNRRELRMQIKDRGPGLSDEARQNIGKTPYSGKSTGLGLGLFLAHSIIERFGGQVSVLSRDGGGVCTEVLIPLITVENDS